jgi:hypothetical protein
VPHVHGLLVLLVVLDASGNRMVCVHDIVPTIRSCWTSGTSPRASLEIRATSMNSPTNPKIGLGFRV